MSTSHFDWVKTLFSCSSLKTFAELKMQIKNDVESRNALKSQYAAYSYNCAENGNCITVLIERTGDSRSATFTLTEKGILVKNERGEPILEAVLTLDDNGQCKPKINGKSYEFWQMRMMALEELFRIS
jgi:hypothetical protein